VSVVKFGCYTLLKSAKIVCLNFPISWPIRMKFWYKLFAPDAFVQFWVMKIFDEFMFVLHAFIVRVG